MRIIDEFLPLNWLSKFANRNTRFHFYGNTPLSEDKSDISTLRDIVSQQTDPLLQLLSGKIDNTYFHSNAIPIDSFYPGNNPVGSNRKNLVPRDSLPEFYRCGHVHLLGKTLENDGSKCWVLYSLGNKGSGLDSLEWAVIHNGNRRGILRQFTVCIVDVVMNSLQMSGLIDPNRQNFKGIPQELPIKTVFTITCGSRDGTFSEDDAKISLVRDNYDMTTPITDKVWTVVDMKMAMGDMEFVPV